VQGGVYGLACSVVDAPLQDPLRQVSSVPARACVGGGLLAIFQVGRARIDELEIHILEVV
jgi:hypothetical protein